MCTYPQKHKCIYPKLIVNSEKDCKSLLISSSYLQHLLFLSFLLLLLSSKWWLRLMQALWVWLEVTHTSCSVMHELHIGEKERRVNIAEQKQTCLCDTSLHLSSSWWRSDSFSILPLVPPFCTENHTFKLEKLENLL